MKKSLRIKLPRSQKGNLNTAYEASVKRWLEEFDADRAEAIYRTETFPLTCERIRAARIYVPQLDLLFVPVGTQPFSPILAIMGNPATCVALLETNKSAPVGLQVEEALSEDLGSVFLHVRVNELDVYEIGLKMKAVYDSRGLPDASRVGADITGGRKTTTVAMAAVGSRFGWRISYVHGEQVRERYSYAHHERVIEIPNVLEVFGNKSRDTALKLLSVGACGAAIKELRSLIRDSLASRLDRQLLTLAGAGAALRSGDLSALSRLAGKAAREIGRHLSTETLDLLKAAARSDSAEASTALLWLAARTRLHEEDKIGACQLLDQIRTLLGQAPPEPDVPCSQLLKRLQQTEELRQKRHQLDELDQLLGRGLGNTASTLL